MPQLACFSIANGRLTHGPSVVHPPLASPLEGEKPRRQRLAAQGRSGAPDPGGGELAGASLLLAVAGSGRLCRSTRAARRGSPLSLLASERATTVVEISERPPEEVAQEAPDAIDAAAERASASRGGTLDEDEAGLDVDLQNLPPGVTCVVSGQAVACTMSEEYLASLDEDSEAQKEDSVFDYVWPRALLLGCSLLYGTNFPLGKVMNEAFPASAAALLRFGIAAVALSPFLPQLKPSVARPAVECGFFVAMGYIGQAIALETEPAATVGFICALAVVWCPLLEFVVDRKPVGTNTWIAAALAIVGVFLLELGPDGGITPSWGDAWALLQCVGFGTAFWRTEKMMARNPDQTLPITAVQVVVAASASLVWFLLDGGSIGNILAGTGAAGGAKAGAGSLELGQFGELIKGFLPAGVSPVALAAVAWTGLVTTALNRLGETTSLGKMSSSDATVLLCTEPIWAAVFAVYLLDEQLGANAIAGGTLITIACLVNSLSPETVSQDKEVVS